jgi:hypothetical protein
MNFTILLIILLLFIAGSIAVSLIVNPQHTKNFYSNIDDHKLIEANVRSRYLKKHLLIIQYVIFALLIILMAIWRLWKLFYPALIFFLCLLLLRGFFARLHILTTTEIEYRKFKKDKSDSQ